ncbi:hypothetical protein FF38_13287 [Lucilia cuprina]|uniref:Uncharacterized protein n=1 Tax=Lucilia cuprina TaxID=7375 RepID=A0A0L0C4W1_LUCCU|nr:hypothetical protein FF38_13287 [Lucilia cuprina]
MCTEIYQLMQQRPVHILRISMPVFVDFVFVDSKKDDSIEIEDLLYQFSGAIAIFTAGNEMVLHLFFVRSCLWRHVLNVRSLKIHLCRLSATSNGTFPRLPLESSLSVFAY